MITVKAHFDGRVLIPQEPLAFPPGCELEITIAAPTEPPPSRPPLLDLAEIAYLYPDNPDLPTDLAAQHNHYRHGTPKRP